MEGVRFHYPLSAHRGGPPLHFSTLLPLGVEEEEGAPSVPGPTTVFPNPSQPSTPRRQAAFLYSAQKKESERLLLSLIIFLSLSGVLQSAFFVSTLLGWKYLFLRDSSPSFHHPSLRSLRGTKKRSGRRKKTRGWGQAPSSLSGNFCFLRLPPRSPTSSSSWFVLQTEQKRGGDTSLTEKNFLPRPYFDQGFEIHQNELAIFFPFEDETKKIRISFA